MAQRGALKIHGDGCLVEDCVVEWCTPYDPDQCVIHLDHNLYWKTGTQQLALWGCPWRSKHRKYADLAAWQRERRQDAHSLLADPLFVDPKAGNWTPRPDSPARKLRAGPRKPPAPPHRPTDGQAPSR